MSNDVVIISMEEETNAWVRKGSATFNGKPFYYKFAWAEGDGYEIIEIDPEGVWSDDEREAFELWQDNHDNFAGYLDDLTFEI